MIGTKSAASASDTFQSAGWRVSFFTLFSMPFSTARAKYALG